MVGISFLFSTCLLRALVFLQLLLELGRAQSTLRDHLTVISILKCDVVVKVLIFFTAVGLRCLRIVCFGDIKGLDVHYVIECWLKMLAQAVRQGRHPISNDRLG